MRYLRWVLALAVFGSVLLWAPAAAAQTAGCQFVLGFATMAAAVSQVGQCQDNQSYSGNGDAVQHTIGGMLVWRKADNWTAFTDGYQTWLNGPSGVQQRLNTGPLFSWEAAAPIAPPSPVVAPPPTAANSWADVDNRLRVAGYGGPYDHGNAEIQALANGCQCRVEWNAAGVTSMGPAAPPPGPDPAVVVACQTAALQDGTNAAIHGAFSAGDFMVQAMQNCAKYGHM